MRDAVLEAAAVCPPEVGAALAALRHAEKADEIRFRMGREVTAVVGEEEVPLGGIRTDARLIEGILARATGQAVYAAQDMLKNGFLILPGGHRLGVCGTGVVRDGAVTTLREVSSLNLRVARQLRGVATEAAERLWLRPCSTLLLGAPASGKTTLLRDLIRQCSDRFGWRVCVSDERGELAACRAGVPQFDLGARTDILTGVDKKHAVEMLLRSMNPRWIALDEISAEGDVETIVRAAYCGVRFLATAHAASFAELDKRPIYRALVRSGVFEMYILLDARRRLHFREGGANVA